jgi:hypothetical protein
MENKIVTRNSGINYLAFELTIFAWGILLPLKQVGIIDNSISTWPFAFTAFIGLLIVAGIIRLNRSKHMEIE